jgi:hypothetical protein
MWLWLCAARPRRSEFHDAICAATVLLLMGLAWRAEQLRDSMAHGAQFLTRMPAASVLRRFMIVA